MKAGARAVGVAESYGDRGGANGAGGPSRAPGERHSTLAAAVVRADRVVDGFGFGACEVGGTDATGAVVDLVDGLGRDDLQYLFVAGIAPAWFNLLDLEAIRAATDLPVVSVSFEASPGLEPTLRREFDGERRETRLATYRRQPDRERLVVNDEAVYVRAVGVRTGDPGSVVRAFTPEGGRPEPLRVARLAARAADRWRADS